MRAAEPYRTQRLNGYSTLPCAAVVSIPAGGSILVYHAAYFSDDTGPFDMFVKTTSLL